MSEMGYVYTLVDPRDHTPKYVGATKQPSKRLYGHIHGATNDSVKNWIDELEKHGESPVMLLIRPAQLENLGDVEVSMIERLSEEWELLNRNKNGYSQRGTGQSENKHIKVPGPVYQKAKELKQKYDYPSLGEAIRHMCQEGGYDV